MFHILFLLVLPPNRRTHTLVEKRRFVVLYCTVLRTGVFAKRETDSHLSTNLASFSLLLLVFNISPANATIGIVGTVVVAVSMYVVSIDNI